ncbi:hypothetical protein LLG95_16715 [bacterium]|nr:hypothetical protein [bacterium]
MTLVELVVALAVMSAIGGIAIETLVLVMKQQEVMEESRETFDAIQCLDLVIRSCIQNLVPGPIGEVQPFSQRTEPNGGMTYQFLNRVPENYNFRDKSEKSSATIALLVGLRVVPDTNESLVLNLEYSTQFVGSSGPIDEPEVQSLVKSLTQFSIKSQGAEGDDESSTLPKAFNVHAEFNVSNGSPVVWDNSYYVKVSRPKTETKEEKE